MDSQYTLDHFDGLMLEHAKRHQRMFGCADAVRFMRFCGFPFEVAMKCLTTSEHANDGTALLCWTGYIPIGIRSIGK